MLSPPNVGGHTNHMRGFRKRWATTSEEEPTRTTDSDVISVAASDEEQGEFEEEAASVGAEVSVIVEPEPDTPIYHRPKVAKRHGFQTGNPRHRRSSPVRH